MSKVYIIEYRFYNEITDRWITKISQEGYRTYEEARAFCESRSKNSGVTLKPFYFQSSTPEGIFEEFYIHEVVLK